MNTYRVTYTDTADQWHTERVAALNREAARAHIEAQAGCSVLLVRKETGTWQPAIPAPSTNKGA